MAAMYNFNLITSLIVLIKEILFLNNLRQGKRIKILSLKSKIRNK